MEAIAHCPPTKSSTMAPTCLFTTSPDSRRFSICKASRRFTGSWSDGIRTKVRKLKLSARATYSLWLDGPGQASNPQSCTEASDSDLVSAPVEYKLGFRRQTALRPTAPLVRCFGGCAVPSRRLASGGANNFSRIDAVNAQCRVVHPRRALPRAHKRSSGFRVSVCLLLSSFLSFSFFWRKASSASASLFRLSIPPRRPTPAPPCFGVRPVH
ncbi:hypothetical protein C8R47DRAFT_720133 [Mycena vitilis]|nr:hypothetical protein C8R47DRAFT_720133 [Mycena vitilis]